MTITGGCRCGAVRYEIGAEAPIAARHCWCRDCQYFSGGAGIPNAVFNKDAIRITGETRVFTSTADSGSIMRRTFCAACGSPLFSEAEPRPNIIIVRVGSLDDREIGKPTSVIWAKSAPTWACFDPDLPRVEGMPPAK